MDRVSAYLLVKTHLRRPESRRRARRLEAMVEAIAERVPQAEAERWAAFALLACIDHDYAEHNPDARGATAAEQAALEGVAEADCAILRGWREGALRATTEPEARALAAALKVADESHGQLVEHYQLASEPSLDQAERELVRFYDRRRGEGDAAGRWFDQSLDLLGGDLHGLARAVTSGWRLVEEGRP